MLICFQLLKSANYYGITKQHLITFNVYEKEKYFICEYCFLYLFSFSSLS